MLSVKMAKFVDETHKQISELKAENASLKSAVEKFTAKRSKKLGTANKQMDEICPHWKIWNHGGSGEFGSCDCMGKLHH